MKPQHSREHNLTLILSSWPAARLCHLAFLLCVTFACPSAHGEIIEIRPALVEKGGVVRRRLDQTGPDAVEIAMDAQVGVVRENGVLRLLQPERATLRPGK